MPSSDRGHYIALGISNDDRMGDDLVFTCKSSGYKESTKSVNRAKDVSKIIMNLVIIPAVINVSQKY